MNEPLKVNLEGLPRNTDGRTDGLTENLPTFQPSLTASDARARIREIGLATDPTERHERTRFENRTRLPEALRKAVLARDWYRCAWCGSHGVMLHVDHIVPWSAGGTNESTNLRTLCGRCNEERSNFLTDTNAARVLPIVYGCLSCAHYLNPWEKTPVEEMATAELYEAWENRNDPQPVPVTDEPRGPVWCFKCWRPGVAYASHIEATLRRQRLMPPDPVSNP